MNLTKGMLIEAGFEDRGDDAYLYLKKSQAYFCVSVDQITKGYSLAELITDIDEVCEDAHKEVIREIQAGEDW